MLILHKLNAIRLFFVYTINVIHNVQNDIILFRKAEGSKIYCEIENKMIWKILLQMKKERKKTVLTNHYSRICVSCNKLIKGFFIIIIKHYKINDIKLFYVCDMRKIMHCFYI